MKETYKLINIHFHWGLFDDSGSEHTIDGFRSAAEGHFVFKKETLTNGFTYTPIRNDEIAVIGVLYQSSSRGIKLPLTDFSQVTAESGKIRIVKPNFLLKNLIPNDFIYATYKGSLTTPPCNETVDWFVSTDFIAFDTEQVRILFN